MDNFSKDYIQYRKQKAHEALTDANLLLENERWNAAVNRMYYASFYIISALLVQEKIRTTSHQGVKIQFSKHFIKTGKIDSSYGKLFAQLFTMRQKGDYGDLIDISSEEAKDLYPKVKALMNLINSYLMS